MTAMPKFGNIHSPAHEVVKDINTIADMGFDFVELNFVEPEGLPQIYRKKAGKIRSALRKHGMFAYAHAPPWADIGSINPIIRVAWLAYSKDIIDVSKKIGVSKLNFHAYTAGIHKTHTSKEFAMKREITKNFVDSFGFLVKYGKRKGVDILYENWIENYKDYTYLIRSVGGLQVNIDPGHAFIQGGMPEVRKFLSLGRKIGHMHFSDNSGKKDDHLRLGKGKLDYASIIRILKKINYDKTVTLEIFEGGRLSPKQSLKYVKNLWVKS